MKQLLFIRYRKPGGIEEGGEQATRTNYQVLSRLVGEENITTCHIHEKLGKKQLLSKAFAVFANFLKGYYYGLSPRRVADIVALARDYRYVFIDRSVFGVIAEALCKKGYQGKIITFFHNVETAYFAAKISPFMPWRPLVLRCVDRNDRLSCAYSHTIIAFNARDAREIERRYRRKPDILSPVVFKDCYVPSVDPAQYTREKPVCLFLGTYFPMNVHGITWFIREVLPFVSIRLQIVGKGMKALEATLGRRENIEIFSDVPDLKPYIEQADFMLLPLFRGSGMKIKTCESLMYGKNIIGTDETFEGYEVDYGKVGALCNTRDEFIQALRHFAAHPVPRFNAYAREVFLSGYSEEVRLKHFAKIFQ